MFAIRGNCFTGSDSHVQMVATLDYLATSWLDYSDSPT